MPIFLKSNFKLVMTSQLFLNACRFCGLAGAADDPIHEDDCKNGITSQFKELKLDVVLAMDLKQRLEYEEALKKWNAERNVGLHHSLKGLTVRPTDCQTCGGPGLAGNLNHRIKCRALYGLSPN